MRLRDIKNIFNEASTAYKEKGVHGARHYLTDKIVNNLPSFIPRDNFTKTTVGIGAGALIFDSLSPLFIGETVATICAATLLTRTAYDSCGQLYTKIYFSTPVLKTCEFFNKAARSLSPANPTVELAQTRTPEPAGENQFAAPTLDA